MTPFIIIGAGGHALVVADLLLSQGTPVLGFTDADRRLHGKNLLGLPVLGDDSVLTTHPHDSIALALGIGSTGDNTVRRRLFENLSAQGYRFPCLIHPSAVVGRSVEIKDGGQIMAGAIIQTCCRIGTNAIVNTRAGLDHDCSIGDHVHIAPGATLCGGVNVETGAHVGAGATILQGVDIGANALIGAGAVIHRPVSAGKRVAGVPGREIKP